MAAANRQARRAAVSEARANPHRGEATLTTGDGQSFRLKMTMNSIVEIEEAFELPISRIGERLNGDVSMKDILAFIGPLVRGGGAELSDREIGALDIDIPELTRAIGAVVRANLAGEAGEGEPEKNA